MQVIKAYLIRQVAENEAAPIAKAHTNKIKNAYESGNYLDMASTLYLKLVPDGQLARESITDTYFYNPTYIGVRERYYYYHYCSNVRTDVNVLKACMYFYPRDTHNNPATIYTNTWCAINACGSAGKEYPDSSLNFYAEDFLNYHHLSVEYNIPILDSSAAKTEYESLVAAYISSGTQSALDAIETYLKGHLYLYPYGVYKEDS